MPTSIDSATAKVQPAANNASGINFQVPLGFGLSQQVSFIFIISCFAYAISYSK